MSKATFLILTALLLPGTARAEELILKCQTAVRGTLARHEYVFRVKTDWLSSTVALQMREREVELTSVQVSGHKVTGILSETSLIPPEATEQAFQINRSTGDISVVSSRPLRPKDLPHSIPNASSEDMGTLALRLETGTCKRTEKAL